ncbi:hypothetical protein DM01DRAFT_1330159 [Hesseltinella vesiculosa]|uniref:Brl1/Brr6 domain-containing protein n=1 Tax=Hesseltinella vesiculosa TaxID=101127 RepID=A0A1X2G235_9FUNG|nr:hypothetical protein DM01DRAFT_1330159 [Hesseltinella vesiculosa]
MARPGLKRSFDEAEQPNPPVSYEFNFTPTRQPHQTLFGIDKDPSTWTASSLTLRYQQRLKQSQIANQPELKPQPRLPHPPANHHYTDSVSNLLYHRSLSLTIISYARLFFTVSLLSILFYVIFQVIWTLRHDLQIKAQEHTKDLVYEIQSCARQYKVNLCDPETRVPALEQKCQEWLVCMNQLPTTVTRARLSAETLAEIINSFMDPISYKTMIFFTILALGSFLLSSFTVQRLPHTS